MNSLRWHVRYYTEALPLVVVTADDMAVSGLPDTGVIDVRVTDPDGYSMTLVGADVYYLSDDATRFGLFNEDGSEYHFRWDEIMGFYPASVPAPLPRLLHGILMPDDEARLVGLIS